MNLKGTKAKDTLVGTGDTDFISGGRGADVLVSNGGDDVMKGGKGADTFVFHASPESTDAPQILDFQPGKDSIVIVTDGFEGNFSAWYDDVAGLVSINAGPLFHPVVTIGADLAISSGDLFAV